MATNKNVFLIGGAVAAAIGAYFYFRKGNEGFATAQLTEPTFKSTLLSTEMEMLADLKAWSERGDSGWSNQQGKIYTAAVREGSAAVKNMHALLWDIWQPGKVENYPFKVNSSLQPSSWANSVGQWWVDFKIRNGII